MRPAVVVCKNLISYPVQQANNYTFKRDGGYLFQGCTSLGDQWYSINQECFSKQKNECSLATSYISSLANYYIFCFLVVNYPINWLITASFGNYSTCLIFLFWVIEFLVLVVLSLWPQISPCRITFYPVGVGLVQLLGWVSLPWEFCSMSLWPLNSAFFVSTVSGHSYFQVLLTSPQVWDHWGMSSPKP